MIHNNELKFDMWMSILVIISEKTKATMFSLSQELPASYSHVFNIIKILQAKDLITSENTGRKHVISLTEKGWRAAENVKVLKKIMEGQNGE